MYERARGLLLLAAGVLLLALVVVRVRDAREGAYPDTAAARWLREAGHHDETPEEIDCIASAMEALLSPAELDVWLAQEPRTITVEELQSLPKAILVADRCRHLQLGE